MHACSFAYTRGGLPAFFLITTFKTHDIIKLDKINDFCDIADSNNIQLIGCVSCTMYVQTVKSKLVHVHSLQLRYRLYPVSSGPPRAVPLSCIPSGCDRRRAGMPTVCKDSGL